MFANALVATVLLIAQLAIAPATGRLSGRIINSDGGTPMADVLVDVQSRLTGTRWRARSDKDGLYEVQMRRCCLRPRRSVWPARMFADLVLTLVEGATLSGRVRLESHGTPAPDLTQMRLFVPLVDGTRFGGEPDGAIRSNGAFMVTGVDAGRRLVRATGVPVPWMLSRVTQNGRDITDVPFEVVPGARLALQDYEESDLYERDTLDQLTRLAVEVTLLVG